MPSKPRIVFVSSNPPEPTQGGSVVYYRQFIERDDFELFIITDKCGYHLDGVQYHLLKSPRLLNRLKKSRFYRWAHDYSNVIEKRFIQGSLLKKLKAFNPDLIYVSPETSLRILGQTIARKLRKPMAAHFMDWPTYGIIAHDRIKNWFVRDYRNFYRKCDLAFTISEGMQEELGEHPNTHVLYPISSKPKPQTTSESPNKDFTVTFAGNLGEWYGDMIRSLIEHHNPMDIRLQIFGIKQNWDAAFEKKARESGIFKGFVSSQELKEGLDKSDCLLLPMGFIPEAKIIESTSFKSKIVEYLATGKPIIVWGPHYCSAVKTAKAFNCAMVCSDPAPEQLIKTILELKTNPQISKDMVANAQQFYRTHLDPDHLCKLAKEQLEKTISSSVIK